MHLCILYTFLNQQRLLPYTALTYWFCKWDGVFTAPYRLGHSIKQIVLFLNVNALVSSPWSLRMCWNVKFFHCWKAASWATLISLNISFCLHGCLSWLHLVNIAWGFTTCFFNGNVVISPMPQPSTLKDHGIPLCQLHWNQSGIDDPTNTWAAASTVSEFTDASKPVTWQKYAFQKTVVP